MGLFGAVLVGALVSVATNGIVNTINGHGFFVGWGQAAIIGAFSGGFSFGIGEALAASSASLVSTGGKLTATVLQTFSHAVLGGAMNVFSGSSFGSGFASGTVGSLFGGFAKKHFGNSFVGTALTGGLGGGLASVVAGGSFGDGFRNGAISTGLNHALHDIFSTNNDSGKKWKWRFESMARDAEIALGSGGW